MSLSFVTKKEQSDGGGKERVEMEAEIDRRIDTGEEDQPRLVSRPRPVSFAVLFSSASLTLFTVHVLHSIPRHGLFPPRTLRLCGSQTHVPRARFPSCANPRAIAGEQVQNSSWNSGWNVTVNACAMHRQEGGKGDEEILWVDGKGNTVFSISLVSIDHPSPRASISGL